MSAHDDLDRDLEAFLVDGPTRLPDPSYDLVRGRVDRTRQRVGIGPWRLPDMNRFVSLGIGTAAVAIVAVVAFQLLPGRGSSGVAAAPSASPPPTAAPTAAPTATPVPTPAPGTLEPFVLARGDGGGVPITVMLPAGGGWEGEPGNAFFTKLGADPPAGSGMIVFSDAADTEWYVPADPCGWKKTMPKKPASTPADLAAALAAQQSRDASAITDVTVDGHAGKAVTLHVPADADFAACDSEQFCSLANPVRDPAESCFRYHQGPGQVDTMWITEVDGQLVVIDWVYYPGTTPEDVAGIEAIARSLAFK